MQLHATQPHCWRNPLEVDTNSTSIQAPAKSWVWEQIEIQELGWDGGHLSMLCSQCGWWSNMWALEWGGDVSPSYDTHNAGSPWTCGCPSGPHPNLQRNSENQKPFSNSTGIIALTDVRLFLIFIPLFKHLNISLHKYRCILLFGAVALGVLHHKRYIIHTRKFYISVYLALGFQEKGLWPCNGWY